MRVAAATNIACPLDGLDMQPNGAQMRCPRGHSFDYGREGYWNLLVVQHKASADPGDSKAMVAARRRFLEAGHFAPIADHVFEVTRSLAQSAMARRSASTPFMVADAGCGEGYYLDRMAELAGADPSAGDLALAGYDVSKWAVQAAAKRTRTRSSIVWLVANSSHPPFLPASVDLMLCLFGFPLWPNFRKVQAAGSAVLLVDPGPDHLIELREIIYPDVRRSQAPPIEAANAAGYMLTRTDSVRFTASLSTAQMVQDLVAMTPHAHRMPEAGRTALQQVSDLSVTVDVVARLLTLSNGG